MMMFHFSNSLLSNITLNQDKDNSISTHTQRIQDFIFVVGQIAYIHRPRWKESISKKTRD